MNKGRDTSTFGKNSASSASLPLAGRRILITRPVGQQQELRAAVKTAGGEAVSLPLLVIEPIVNCAAETDLRKNLARLHEFDLLVFVSANAARFGVQAITDAGASLMPSARLLAVGAATAREASLLLGLPVHCPRAESGSEPLLEMPQLADVAGCKIAIFRGEGGRELLADELWRRDAEVTYFEVYRRAPAAGAGKLLQQILADGLPDCIFLTSAEALQNWHDLIVTGGRRGPASMAPGTGHPSDSALPDPDLPHGCPIAALFALPLIVPSRRVAEIAAQYGFGAVVNAGDAGAQAMVEALAAHFRHCR